MHCVFVAAGIAFCDRSQQVSFQRLRSELFPNRTYLRSPANSAPGRNINDE
jgi:hypothetical protein